MTRPYHSPSSLALGDTANNGCERAWAYRYIEGRREPSTPAQIFGVHMHKIAESYFGAGVSPELWDTPGGKAFQGGLNFIPLPRMCERIEVEHGIGRVDLGLRLYYHAESDSAFWSYREEEGDGLLVEVDQAHVAARALAGDPPPATALVVHGVKFAGFRDLVVSPSLSERKRLGLESTGPILYDWKSSADARRYAKTREQLDADVQRNLYGLDVCESHGKSLSHARWVYFDKKTASNSKCVDSTLSRDAMLENLSPAAELARKLDAIPDVASASMNPGACENYGGCPHHRSRGGPCDARVKLSALVTKGKPKLMTTTPENTTPATEGARSRFASTLANRQVPAQDSPVIADEAPTATRKPRAPRTPAAAPAPAEAPATEAPERTAARAQTVEDLAKSLAVQRETLQTRTKELADAALDFERAKTLYETAAAEVAQAQTAIDSTLAEIRGVL